MGKCAVIAFYAAVLLLAWWPWNVLLLIVGTRCARQLHDWRFRSSQGTSRSRNFRRYIAKRCADTLIAGRHLEAARKFDGIIRSQ